MDNTALAVMGFVVPIGITLFGVYLAYTGFKSVLETFESGWQSVNAEPGREEFV